MKLTNRTNLPEPIVRAIENDDYSKGDAHYSCSELIAPIRITLLKQRHWNEITEDVLDNLWALFGKLGHKLAEQAGADNALLEERLFAEVKGRKISGATDVAQYVLDDGIITDYKFTSVYTRIFGDRMGEWTDQQNIYAWLFGQHGFKIQRLQICAFYRDWRRSEAITKGIEYPPQAEIIPLEIWTNQQQQEFIERRVEGLVHCENLMDDELPKCTLDEMWAKPTTYAVMKDGGKRALRVLESEQEAVMWMEENKKGDHIVKRPGERVRCEGYCSVAPFCNVYQQYKQEKR